MAGWWTVRLVACLVALLGQCRLVGPALHAHGSAAADVIAWRGMRRPTSPLRSEACVKIVQDRWAKHPAVRHDETHESRRCICCDNPVRTWVRESSCCPAFQRHLNESRFSGPRCCTDARPWVFMAQVLVPALLFAALLHSQMPPAAEEAAENSDFGQRKRHGRLRQRQKWTKVSDDDPNTSMETTAKSTKDTRRRRAAKKTQNNNAKRRSRSGRTRRKHGNAPNGDGN